MTQSCESREDAEEETRKTSFLRRLISATIRLPVSAFSFFFRPAKTSASRRALLQGRLWKLLPQASFSPLVTRIPHPDRNEPPTDKPVPRSIGGINIDPVPVTNFNQAPNPRHIPVHRPPGAVAEPQFMAGCTRCGDCIDACPYDAIVLAPDRLGSVAGTPIIEADHSACMMCEDFPCITSCEPGVLTDQLPPIMGTARVTPQLCLAYHHTTCTVCSERCPVEGAITVIDGKPTVEQATCTGCGVCRYVCPAPENAILLMPAFERPGRPTP